MAKFRILSLDGGGSWALIQVMALQALYTENATGHNILKDFDLVAANSGGSITLGGLIEDLSLKTLLDSYFLDETKRKHIFSPVPPLENIENGLYKLVHLAPRYSTAAKLTALQQLLPHFGSTKIATIPGRIAQAVGRSPHFVIFGFDYDRCRAAFFRSNLKSPAGSGTAPLNPTLAEAINASSTAPVKFFDAPAEIGDRRYWDGAIAGYNNPVLGAVVEALAGHVTPEDVQVLSIGTGSVRRPILQKGQVNDSGVMQMPQTSTPINDLEELAGSIIDDPPDAATFIAHIALRQPLPDPNKSEPVSGSIIRMSPMVQPVQRSDGSWGPPVGLSVQEFNDVAKIEMDAVEQAEVLKIQNLANQWINDRVVNQAIRANPDNFHTEMGQGTFSGAKEAWLRLRQTQQPIQ